MKRSKKTAKKIGRYEIRKELGRGTMGVVYEAWDADLERTVALKTIGLVLAAPKADRAAFEKRFLTEARIAARLSHPGIVVVHDVGRDADTGILYIALEYLVGETLAERIAGKRPMEWREALGIVRRVAQALHHAHSHGVIHRDVKPANIMILRSGEPKIMDFGIARLDTGQLTTPGQLFGTPLYMSPEQALGQPTDARSDLFSLGTIAYALFTGQPPFEAPNLPGILARVAHQFPPPPSETIHDLPADVDYLVARAMAKSPADRYSDAKVLAEDADDVLSGRPARHRAGWTAPQTGDRTLASKRPTEAEPLPALEPMEAAPKPRRRRSRRSRATRILLMATLLAAGVTYFRGDGGAWEFWRRSVPKAADALWQRAATEWARPTLAPAVVPPLPAPTPTSVPAPPPASPAASPEVSTTPTQAHESAVESEEPAEPDTREPTAETRSPTQKAKEAPPPGQLAITFEHHLETGILEVWVDSQRVVREKLDSRVTRKILTFEFRKGSVQQSLKLSPGRHEVRVRAQWGKNSKTATIRATFRSGVTRRLEVKVGRLRGNLSLDWK